jgi:predicted nucleotidyltransferase
VITHEEILQARDRLLDRAVAFFVDEPGVTGIFLAGSIPAGSADAYSDIDLRVIATPDAQTRLLAGRLEWPAQWGDLLFNEWLDGAHHCISHFRPFLKVDVFYWTLELFKPSPWFKMPAKVFLDRDGSVRGVLEASRALSFAPPMSEEVSRILSKALAGAHETARRARRGELFYAQTLLEELRGVMTRLDMWIQGIEPSVPQELKMATCLSPDLATALEQSYVALNGEQIDRALVGLSHVLVRQLPELHKKFGLNRSLPADLHAADLIRTRQIR